MMRNGFLTLLGFVSVVILAILIQRTNAIDTQAHDRYLQSVRELRNLSTDLVNATEDAREGDLSEHADMDSAFAGLRPMFTRAREVPRFVRMPTADSLETLLRGFEAASEDRERQALEFKSVNLRLQAALDSMSGRVQHTVDAVWEHERTPRSALGVHMYGTQWLEHARRGGRNARRGMDSASIRLRESAEVVSEGSRREVQNLLGDFARVERLSLAADSLSDAIDDAPGSDNAVAMRKLYEAEFEWANLAARRAEKLLALYAAVLLTTVLLVVYGLQRSRAALNAANDALEAKVRERTAALEQANHDLLRARDEALQASIAKSHFLANMSHELRTPLNSVIGFTNILLKNKRGALAAQELGFLTRIVENGRHLLSLINDILDLSKIEAGKVELELGAVDVNELVLETVKQFGSDPKGTGVNLCAVVPDSAPSVLADAGRLKQILINLVGNALKFTEQGSVTIALRLDPETGRAARIEVIDTGIGIPQDRLGAIFEAFQQADTSTTRRFGGTGLGLAISSSLAQLMGCRIEVSSVVGEGSVFTLILPTTAVVPAAAPRFTTTAEADDVGVVESSGKELMLVIDDDADSRLLMMQMLEDAGYEVLAANSGPQGLRMAQEFRPRAILLDLMMPGMSGFDVLKELKNDAELSHIPVIVVSMVARDYAGSLLGAVDLLEKPLAREALLATIQRNVRRPVRRILVVDDDRDTRRLIASYLSADDVVIETAANGFEALSVMSRFAPDAVVIDLMMPGMSGAECVRAIRRDGRYQNTPIVVVTAKDLNSGEIGKLKAFTTEVLKKGEDLERELRLTLESCLGKQPTTTEMAACA